MQALSRGMRMTDDLQRSYDRNCREKTASDLSSSFSEGHPSDSEKGPFTPSTLEKQADREPHTFLYLVSLLSSLNSSNVRADFAAGKFQLPGELDVSQDELELFISSVVPPWNPSESFHEQLQSSISVLRGLGKGAGKLGLLGSAYPPRPFRQWSQILRSIASSPYWNEVRAVPVVESAEMQPQKSIRHQETSTEKVVQRDTATCTSCETEVLKVQSSCTRTVGLLNVTIPVVSDEVSCESPTRRCRTSTKEGEGNQGVLEDAFRVLRTDQRGSPIVQENHNKDNLQRFSSDLNDSVVSPRPASLSCSWCKRGGHSKISCWRRLRLCLICGGKHKMKMCAKYVQRPLSSFFECPVCKGNHLGKHCPRNKKVEFCNWCGKSGHSLDNCWRRLGACLICGDIAHQMSSCSRFNAGHLCQSPILFPPWCVRCGSQHLGCDCDSPFME